MPKGPPAVRKKSKNPNCNADMERLAGRLLIGGGDGVDGVVSLIMSRPSNQKKRLFFF